MILALQQLLSYFIIVETFFRCLFLLILFYRLTLLCFVVLNINFVLLNNFSKMGVQNIMWFTYVTTFLIDVFGTISINDVQHKGENFYLFIISFHLSNFYTRHPH